ncbi:lycopene cyclase domain-containing protein [Microbacterium sp. NPDC056234]|uniref:lycopene cyclase domain-containing protein n=1 Tax=Microbacterium sp. NPDC056234 TaxID=3345757 RepID=UPI0035DD8DAE
MTYALLSLIFLGVAGVLAVAAALIGRRRPHLGAVALSMAALLLLTAVFDTVMIGVGFFTYADTHLLGARIGLAPIEDFAYPIAGAVLLPAIWTLLRTRRGPHASRAEAGR